MNKALKLLARSLGGPMRPYVRSRVAEEVTLHTGLTPITQTKEADIFVAGYPKSGNTWFQNLITGVLYGADPFYAPDTLVQYAVPDVQQIHPYYKRFQDPMFFKTHYLPQPEYRRVVYLLRDGRDVMVSYLHHLAALQGKPLDFLDMVQTGAGLFPCKWHQHVLEWHSNPYGAEIIEIRYEDLKKDTVQEVKRFCAFAQIARDDALIARVVENASFEKMRQKEIATGWDHPLWPKDKPFVRRGKVGSYKDEMPPEVLEAFLNDARNTLLKCGYLCD